MQWRNPAYNAAGSIDCEINHPVYGWVPFTVVEGDAGASFDVAEMRAEILAAGGVAAYVPPPPQPPRVPAEISKAGLIRATRLREYAPGVSLWAAIRAGIETLDQDTRDEWDAINDVPRDHPLVVSMAQTLGVLDQMDDIWIEGAALQ